MKPGKFRLNIWKLWRPIYKWTWAQAQKSSYAHASAWLSQKKGLNVLDLGTGTGEYIESLPQGHRYIFTDIDLPSLKQAQKRAQAHLSGNYECQELSAEEALEAHKNSDVIFMIHVVSVIGDHEKMIRQAIDSLKPGGSLLVYISRMSRTFSKLDNPLLLGLGFKLINLDQIEVPHQRQNVGLLNECYQFTKPY